MTVTREQVEALVARLVGKTWYVTDSTGQRWADDAPEDAARALLATMTELEQVKGERDVADHRAGAIFARIAGLEADGDAARKSASGIRARAEAAKVPGDG